MNGIYFISVLLAGVLSFFSPCVFPLLPIYMANIVGEQPNTAPARSYWQQVAKPAWHTLCFVAGIGMVFFLLGYGAGALGQWIYSPYFQSAMGIIVIVLGLHQMELFQFNVLNRQKQVELGYANHHGAWRAYLLGLSFSFSWTPCIGPVLGSVLSLAASGGSGALYGGLLMLIYVVGLAVPFIVVALASTWVMQYFSKLKRHLLLLKRIGGAIIVLMGVLMVFGHLHV